MSEQLPESIGKYRVIAKLGQGGMARVLLTVVAGPAEVSKLLVVKQLREELSEDPEYLTMFLDEARLAARLSHPNVVQTYEVVTEGDRHFIAMDYLEGQPLHRLIHRVGRAEMPLGVHLRILAETLAGLHYAHTLEDYDGSPLRVVHRDVSPQNVFVTYDGQVKVVDFGIAKAIGARAFTKQGVLKGKLAFMAPEQARAERVDARADVFSVGVMIWEAIARRCMTEGLTEIAVLGRRISGRDPGIRSVAADAPPRLLDICERAVAAAPDDRYPSAAALREALEEYLDGESGRRSGAREVGALVSEVFAKERVRIRSLVDRQVKALRSARDGEAAGITILDIQPLQSSAGQPTPASAGRLSGTVAVPASTTLASGLVTEEGGAALAETLATRLDATAGPGTSGGRVAVTQSIPVSAPALARRVGPWVVAGGLVLVGLVVGILVLPEPTVAVDPGAAMAPSTPSAVSEEPPSAAPLGASASTTGTAGPSASALPSSAATPSALRPRPTGTRAKKRDPLDDY